MFNVKLAFIGGGNMAEALLRGIIQDARYTPEEICVTDVVEERLAFLRDTYGVQTSTSNAEAGEAAETIILAVKPQQIAEVIDTLRDVASQKLVVSIAAGVPLATLREHARHIRFIRVMPNTPSLVGSGMSVICPAEDVTDAELQRTRELFSSVGKVLNVPTEAMLDAATGVSGSGPAFVFLFMEAMADGGVKAGLPRPLARQLAEQTVMGAAKLAMESGKHPGELKDMVTSPGGTTIYGVGELEDRGFRGAVMEAVYTAALRASELGEK